MKNLAMILMLSAPVFMSSSLSPSAAVVHHEEHDCPVCYDGLEEGHIGISFCGDTRHTVCHECARGVVRVATEAAQNSNINLSSDAFKAMIKCPTCRVQATVRVLERLGVIMPKTPVKSAKRRKLDEGVIPDLTESGRRVAAMFENPENS